MTRIDAKFAKLKAEGKKAFVAYIMGGDPDVATSLAVMKGLPAAGVDVGVGHHDDLPVQEVQHIDETKDAQHGPGARARTRGRRARGAPTSADSHVPSGWGTRPGLRAHRRRPSVPPGAA